MAGLRPPTTREGHVTAPRTRRVVRPFATGIVLVLAILVVAPPAMAGVVDQPVKTTSANELGGAADGAWLGWSEAPSSSPAAYRALASKQGASPISLGENGKVAFMGGITGTTAVFQQRQTVENTDIYRFALEQEHRTKFGTKVNTANFEFRPSLSEGRLLFGRLVFGTHTETIRVFTLASAKTRVLDTIHSDATHSVAPGQISGKFAVWHRCAPKCNSFLWNRQADTITKLVNGSGKNQWWPAVAPNGTVYYVREGVQCDSVAKIVKDPRNGPPVVIFTLPNGTTASHLSVDDVGAMGRNVFYSENDCGPPITYDVRLLEID
jgi:hypothetical protein